MDAAIATINDRWRFARGLTRDLLESLDADDLTFSPGEGLGALGRHFRHLGRVQENYLRGLATGTMAFGLAGATHAGELTRQSLIDYLDRIDAGLDERLATLDPDAAVQWFGQPVGVQEHLTRMANHEVLHHGMFVVYLRLLGRRFPASWAAWGL
jgi:uncharacterized damage-inducible protein DinB